MTVPRWSITPPGPGPQALVPVVPAFAYDDVLAQVERLTMERDQAREALSISKDWGGGKLVAVLRERDEAHALLREREAEAERLRAALALRVPAAPPTWNSGGQHVVWITNDEDAEARKVLGSTPPLGGINRSDRARILALLDGAA